MSLKRVKVILLVIMLSATIAALETQSAQGLWESWIETVTEEKIETITVPQEITVMPEECEKGPKFEVKAGGKITASVAYANQEVEVELTASGAGTFAVETCYQKKIIREKVTEIYYQAQRIVYGETILAGAFEEIDWLHPDHIGTWVEVNRVEYEVTRTELINLRFKLVEPPGNASEITPLKLVSGSLIPDFRYMDGFNFTAKSDTLSYKATIVSHKVLLDGETISNETMPIKIGAASLYQGNHMLTLRVVTDPPGVFDFEFPIDVLRPIEMTIEGVPTLEYDKSTELNVTLKNNDYIARTVNITATAPSGWTIRPPINPVFILPNSEEQVSIDMHCFPKDDNNQIATIVVNGFDELAGEYVLDAPLNTTVTATISYANLSGFERDLIDTFSSINATMTQYISEIAEKDAEIASLKTTDTLTYVLVGIILVLGAALAYTLLRQRGT